METVRSQKKWREIIQKDLPELDKEFVKEISGAES